MTADSKPWLLAETTYGWVKEQPYEVAVLPFGATEPHNLHLPYGTDTFEADIVGALACERAWRAGAKVVLLPTIPYGTETNMAALPLAMNLNPSTLLAIVSDLVETLTRCGIRKVLLLNSHGGNDFKPILRELAGRSTAQLFLCDWFRMIGDVYHEVFQAKEDHAGEMETSVILAVRPDLVARTAEGALRADEGATAPFRIEALSRGWVGLTRPWHSLTTNTGSGNPHAATAEKGERILEIVADRLSQFLVDLAGAELDERFPFA